MTGFTAIADLPRLRQEGRRAGITSVCSSHPVVIEAALVQGIADDIPVLIEATCNQVNQDGGYTGMSPAAFRTFAESIAGRAGSRPAHTGRRPPWAQPMETSAG
jgi:D-tagatose-1,6-bisphosphate aldolase subunit GatZ/KbaZ